MRPVEAQKPSFYSKDRNKIRINTFIRDHNLHPIALRCFLYDLYSVLQYNITGATVPNPDEKPDSEWDNILESKKNRDIRVNEERNSMLDSAKLWLKSMLAERMIVDLAELIHEIEDLFESVNKVKEYFDNSAVDCLEEIDRRNDRADTVIAGSKLSAVNCWKLLEGKIHAGDEGGDDDIIDDDLSAELNNLIYNGYYKHVNANAKTTISLGGEDFRIPTDYVEVLRSRLQRHFMHKITLTYGKLFPENVVDAIRYDCGVKNYWNILQSNSSHLTLDDFVCTTPYEKSFYDQAREKGLAAFDVTETLNRLLSLAIGKSEPRCGLVSISADADYTNRYIVLNKSILTKKTSFSGAENDEETDITEELSYIIPGVSTSMIEGVNVNACFTGSSPDYIACMTTYSGLEPSNFTALLAPIFDKNAPQDAMSYYRAYREYINEVVTDPTKITPHLDRSWHIADRLADITAEYTTSVWKHAAKAFVYGFVYNVIKVTLDGSVFFGDYNNNIFKDIGHDGTLTVTFISPAQQAALANPATSTAEKKDLLNAILNKVFERLTNDPALSTAIIQYGEAQLAEDRMFAKAGFLKMALEEENVASASYNCILDVIDGYYNGSYKAKHIEKNYAIESSQYMFDVVITSIFNQIKSLTASPAEVENTAKQTVQLLYKKAVCDNPAPVAVAAVSDFGGADPQSDLEAQNMLAGILGGITASSVASANQKPFALGGRFELNRALHMIDQLLRESEN